MKRLLTLAAAAAAALGTGAQAQEMEAPRKVSRFDLGVYAGGSITSPWFDSRTVTVSGGEVTENDDEETFTPGYAPAFGLQATFWATPRFGIRAHGAYVPMRAPFMNDGFFDVFGDNATERQAYTLNTYLYDLDLVARPWVTSDVPGWLSGVYFFVGGGGLTTDVAGDGGGLGCEPNALAAAACIPYEVENATVGQGTAGAGMDLLRIGNSLALFGELAAHVYDSPAHVGDAWLGPVQVPPGGTVRIADDRTAVTTRLVAGLKWMFGDQSPAPVVIPPPLPPEVLPPPPPPVEETRTINVCVVEGGTLREVQAQYNVQRGDTMVNGQMFGTAYPATTGYAAGATWYINSDVITVGGQNYVKFGLPRVLGVTEVTRIGEYQGVSVFAEPGATGGGTPDILYVPVRPGCEFQPYQKEVKVRNVRG